MLQLLQIGNALAGANSITSPLPAVTKTAPTVNTATGASNSKRRTFKEDWYPMEWMVFVTFGPFTSQAFPGWMPTNPSANRNTNQTTNLLNLLAESALHSSPDSTSPVDKLVGSKRDRESLETSSANTAVVADVGGKRARTVSSENQLEESSMATMVIDESSSLFILDSSSHAADTEIEVEIDEKPSLNYPAPFPVHFEMKSDNPGDEKMKVYLQRSQTSQEEFNRLYKIDLQMKRLMKLIEIFANDTEKQSKYLQELEQIQIM